MSERDSSKLPRLPRVEPFAFYDDSLVAVILDNQEVVLPIRSVCMAIGLDPQSQSERLRTHDVLAQGLRIVKVPTGTRVQSVLAIHRRYLAFWLATIPPNLVAEDARPKLIRYQEELVELLDTLYGTGSTELVAPSNDASLTTLNQRLSAVITELRETRDALLAAQQRTETQLTEQDVRLSTVEGLLKNAKKPAPVGVRMNGP